MYTCWGGVQEVPDFCFTCTKACERAPASASAEVVVQNSASTSRTYSAVALVKGTSPFLPARPCVKDGARAH